MEKEKAKSDNTKNYKYPLKLKSKEELYEFLRNVNMEEKRENPMCSVYFLVEYKNIDKNGETKVYKEPIYFFPYEEVFFPSPCELTEWDMKQKELEEFVQEMYEMEYWEEALEYENIFQKGNKHYEIDVPQCTPFLPEKITILKMLSESECLDFLING